MFVHLARIPDKVVLLAFRFNNYGGSYDTTMVLCRILYVAVSSLTTECVGMCSSRKYPYRKFREEGYQYLFLHKLGFLCSFRGEYITYPRINCLKSWVRL